LSAPSKLHFSTALNTHCKEGTELHSVVHTVLVPCLRNNISSAGSICGRVFYNLEGTQKWRRAGFKHRNRSQT